MRFSICALFYGDYPALARRLLTSLQPRLTPVWVADVRLGLNNVSKATAQVVREFVATAPVVCHVAQPRYLTGQPPYKYPVMRRLFYASELPPLADAVMWFDDDSHVDPQETHLFAGVAARLACADVGVVGEVWHKDPEGRQLEAVRAQPWFTDQVLGATTRGPFFRFATGGWWAARTDFLRRWDYPFPALRHNGGDVLLGVLCEQQRLRVSHILRPDAAAGSPPLTVHVNDDGAHGKNRRGLNLPPLWRDWEPGAPRDLTHQNFGCRYATYFPAV